MNENRNSLVKWALTAAICFCEYLLLKNSGDTGLGIVVLISLIGGLLFYRERYSKSSALQGAAKGARRALKDDGISRFIFGLVFILFLGLFVAPFQFAKMIARRLPQGGTRGTFSGASAVKAARPAPTPSAPAPTPSPAAPAPHAAAAPVPPRTYTPPAAATQTYTPRTSAQPSRPAPSYAQAAPVSAKTYTTPAGTTQTYTPRTSAQPSRPAPSYTTSTAVYTPRSVQPGARSTAPQPTGSPAQRKIQEAIAQMDHAERQPLDKAQQEALKRQLRQNQARRRAQSAQAQRQTMSTAQQEALKQRLRSSMAQRRRTGKGSDY